MDAPACRSQLDRLLRDETSLLALLEQQLESEHALLKSNDIDGLDQAGAARQDTVQRLLRVDDERRSLAACWARAATTSPWQPCSNGAIRKDHWLMPMPDAPPRRSAAANRTHAMARWLPRAWHGWSTRCTTSRRRPPPRAPTPRRIPPTHRGSKPDAWSTRAPEPRPGSDVEAEVHDIAFPDDVFLAFQPQLAGFLRARLALAGHEVVVADHFGADEAALEIRVDHARRLRRG